MVLKSVVFCSFHTRPSMTPMRAWCLKSIVLKGAARRPNVDEDSDIIWAKDSCFVQTVHDLVLFLFPRIHSKSACSFVHLMLMKINNALHDRKRMETYRREGRRGRSTRRRRGKEGEEGRDREREKTKRKQKRKKTKKRRKRNTRKRKTRKRKRKTRKRKKSRKRKTKKEGR